MFKACLKEVMCSEIVEIVLSFFFFLNPKVSSFERFLKRCGLNSSIFCESSEY